MNKINLRVFKRDKDAITLLWDKDKLSYEKYKDSINVRITKDSKSYIAQPIIKEQDSQPTIMMAIEHRPNMLNFFDKCEITVIVDREEVASLAIFPSGVLPDTEKDTQEKNMHLFAWDKKRQVWKKITGVETDDGFAMLVKRK